VKLRADRGLAMGPNHVSSVLLAMDDDERIAVTALGDMRNSDSDFVHRVSHLPILSSALRAYEHGKASSKVVKVRTHHIASHLSLPHTYSVWRRNHGIISNVNIPSSNRQTPRRRKLSRRVRMQAA
jgi:hypothetical protein